MKAAEIAGFPRAKRVFAMPWLAKWLPADRNRPLGARRTTLSGLRDDRCAFERGHHQIRCQWIELAAPLEKHSPLDATEMLRVHLDLIFGERRTT